MEEPNSQGSQLSDFLAGVTSMNLAPVALTTTEPTLDERVGQALPNKVISQASCFALKQAKTV